jgi:hypothetical protein
VLGAGAEAEPAAAAEPPAAEKKKKKKKAGDDEPAAKPKKAASAAAAAGAGASNAAAAAVAAPAAEKKKGKKAEAAAAAAAAEPAPGVGEPAAAEPPFLLPLCLDKVLRVSYAVSGAADGAAVLTLRVEPKSLKKTVDWVDVAFLDAAQVKAGGAAHAALAAGAAGAGSFRIVKELKARDKEKKTYSKKGSVALAVADATQGFAVAVRISYLVTGTKAPAHIEGGVALVRAAALLVPHALAAEAYRGVMLSEGASLAGANTAQGLVPLISAGAPADGGAAATFACVLGLLRVAAVSRNDKQALLYARTLGGAHVAGLLKLDEAGKAMQVTLKSAAPEHAARMLAEVIAAADLARAQAEKEAKRAGKGDDDE